MKDEPAFKPLQGNLTLFLQGISVSTQPDAAKSGSLSHTYCSGKAPLEVLVEKLAYLFNRILGISFLLEMIRVE